MTLCPSSRRSRVVEGSVRIGIGRSTFLMSSSGDKVARSIPRFLWEVGEGEERRRLRLLLETTVNS
jgi:hypothetical protein